MYTIIMTNDKQLATTARTNLYQKDNLVDKIQFLFPPQYGELNLDECDVEFIYSDISNNVHSVALKLDDESYKDKLLYHFTVDSNITQLAGDIVGYIKFTMEDEENNNTYILHTGDVTITILPTKDYGLDDD